MALGGGTYLTQNKVLPGAYFQFASNAKATAVLSERGVAGIALELNWGMDGAIFDVTAADLQKNSLKVFGYDYAAEELKGIRDLFAHASIVHMYKLTSGGAKASNVYATAVCAGKRGNDIRIGIQTNVDDIAAFDVTTYVGTVSVDTQTVSAASELVSNDFVVFKADAQLEATAGTPLTGGTNAVVDAAAHQAFLDKLESYPDTNAVGYVGSDDAIKALYVAFAKRMRDDIGIRMQAVVFNYAADSISGVNVKNSADVVYWVTGVIAGTAVNKSATNMKYDGEYAVSTDYTQKQLEASILAGEFVLHRVGTEIHVLEDINSLVSVTDEQGEIFKDNQTVRTIDMIATSIASIFAVKYLGKVPNNASGRMSLWSDIVKIHQNLADINAIENFSSEDITVEQGTSKKAVVVNSAITVINTVIKLYMKTVIA